MKNGIKLFVLAAILGILAVACESPVDGEDIPVEPVITITTQPVAHTNVVVGSISGSLYVAASITSDATLNYRWYSNTSNSNSGGTVISGSNNASFAIPATLAIGMYYYYCEVRANHAVSVRSAVAMVTVTATAIPVITINVAPVAHTSVTAGSISGSLTVAASVTDGAALSYQWYSNTSGSNIGGTAIGGAIGASLVIPATLTAGTYYYFCEVNASGGAIPVRSNVATVTVGAIPVPVITITAHPVAHTSVTAGNISGSLTVAASVTDGAVLSYQWYSNTVNSNTSGTAIGGAIGASLVIPPTLTAGTYYYFCEVNASGGAIPVRSNVATVTVGASVGSFMEMVSIPGGTFRMGSPSTEPDRWGDENYRTANGGTVTMSGFLMGKYQVTQAQYKAVMNNADPSYFKGDNLPVEQVSWYDAIVFCNRLSMMEGLTPAYRISGSTDPSVWGAVPATWDDPLIVLWNTVEIVSGSTGYQLPTEAQWEYACRAGTTTAFNWGTNQITSAQANFRASSNVYNGSPAGEYRGTTTAVGTFAANGFGLYDMHGNVFEWCWDWHIESYDNAGGSNNPLGVYLGSSRVYRGGSWSSFGQEVRSAVRYYGYPDNPLFNLGFRVVRGTVFVPVVITITDHPAPRTSLTIRNISGSLTVAASVTEGAALSLSYQWYSNTVNSNTSGFAIGGATGASFVFPQTLTIGTYYYYCEVSASGGAIPVRSNVAMVTVGSIVEMVQIPAGTFLMGSPWTEPGRDTNENYRTVNDGIVTMSSFSMGKYPVTQAQYKAVMNGADPSWFKGDDLPVERVSWYDAIVFCNRLSMMEGLTPAYRISGSTDPSVWGAVPTSSNATWNAVEIVGTGYRLPTEAQWEYACRAGTTTAFNWGTNQITSAQANFDASGSLYNGSPAGEYRGTTTVVGTFAPNAWGLYDMHGNVWEWCWDRLPTENIFSSNYRVFRGGSWSAYGRLVRSAVRSSYDPSVRGGDLGFRLARP